MKYEPANYVASGPQPGAVALRDYAHELGLGDAGIYNPRLVRGSGSALSLHAEGRAVDLTIGDETDHELTALVDLLVHHHVELGVQQVIWQRRVWTVGKTWRTYTGTDPHTSHAHVELTRAAAAGLTLAVIRSVLEVDKPTPSKETRAVEICPTPSGHGYWICSTVGGVYAFGDAGFHGSLPQLGVTPAAPIVGMAATPTGQGYWLLGGDGGVFCFGDAQMHGSAVPYL